MRMLANGMKTIHVFGFAVFMTALMLGAPAQAEDDFEDEGPQPFIVKIYADWCGTCQRLKPVWQRIQEDLGEEAQVVLLDVTDKGAVEASKQRAKDLGIEGFFKNYKSKTGTIGVLKSSGSTVSVYKGEGDFSVYERALENAL